MPDSSIPTLHGAPVPAQESDPSPIGPMLAYWNSLPRHRGLPPRAAIDPDAIRPFLSVCGILERSRSGRCVIRLAGQAIERRFGMPLRGLPLHTFVDLDGRARVEEAFATMFEGPAVVTLTLVAPDAMNGEAIVTMMVLPLCDEEGAATRAMMVVAGDASRAPRGGFELRDLQVSAIATQTATPVVRPDGPVLRVIQGGLSGTP